MPTVPPPAPVSDAALVAAALAEPAQYRYLVERHGAALERYVKRLLGRARTAAEDVVQEVFIKAYVNLNDYDRGRPFAPWLYRIAHNEAVSFLRRKNLGANHITGEDADVLLSRFPDEGSGPPLPGLQAALNAAFEALSSKYRDVLVLRLLEDKDYDEISEILALPPGTVAIRVKRGLEQLRSTLRHWRS